MTITLDLWQLVTAIGTMLGAIWVGFVALGRVLLNQIQANLQRDSETARKAASAVAKVERDLMTLKAELPEKYVRREDYIRGQTVIEAKLDAISSELKVVQIQGAKRAS